MSGLSGNGWNEWSKHVLKELERLNENYKSLSDGVQEVKTKVSHFNPEEITTLRIKVESLTDRDSDQEARLREMENRQAMSASHMEKIATIEKSIIEIEKREAHFLGKWGIIAIVGSLIVSGLIGFLFKAAEPTKEASKHPAPRSKGHGSAEKALSSEELAALRVSPK